MYSYQYNLSDLVLNNGKLVEHQLKDIINNNENIAPSCINVIRTDNIFYCIFTLELNNSEKELLDSLVYNFKSYEEREYKTDIDNKLIVSIEKRSNIIGHTVVTHDWCRKETWYQMSVNLEEELNRVTNHIYTFSNARYNIQERENNKSYNVGDKYIVNEFRYLYYECIESGISSNEMGYIPIYPNIEYTDGTAKFICKELENIVINVEYGRLFNDIMLSNYRTKIYKNNELLNSSSIYSYVEFKRALDNNQDIELAINILDGDYCIDYENQSVFFKHSINENDIITANYYKATTSEFFITKINGYKTRIYKSEAQFSNQVKVRQAITNQFIVNNSVIKEIKYKTYKNYIDESNYSYPRISKIPNNNILKSNSITELTEDLTIFFWDFASNAILDSNTMIKLKIDSDLAFIGEYATISFYMELENE
jgi:hypothetical protein